MPNLIQPLPTKQASTPATRTTSSAASYNPWDDGFLTNAKHFLHYQVQAFLFLAISLGWVFVWSLKQLQALLKKAS